MRDGRRAGTAHLQSGVLRLLGGTGLPSISAARTPSCTMSSTTPLAARRIPLCADAFVRLSVCCSHHREPQHPPSERLVSNAVLAAGAGLLPVGGSCWHATQAGLALAGYA